MRRIEYKHYERLIYFKAYSFSAATQVPFDELVSQGNLIFCEAQQDFDPSRAKFSTWLYRRLDQGLSNFSKNYFHASWHDWSVALSKESEYPEIVDVRQMTFERMEFNDQLDDLSACAKVIVAILLDNPVKTLQLKGHEKSRIIRGRLYKYLLKEGWGEHRIWPAFNELKQLFYNK